MSFQRSQRVLTSDSSEWVSMMVTERTPPSGDRIFWECTRDHQMKRFCKCGAEPHRLYFCGSPRSRLASAAWAVLDSRGEAPLWLGARGREL